VTCRPEPSSEHEPPRWRDRLTDLIARARLASVNRAIVVERRPNLAEKDLDQVTDGRVVTGRQAVELGLVDHLGGVRDAFDVAKKRTGIDRAQLVKYHRSGARVGSAYAATPAPPADAEINLMQINMPDAAGNHATGFYYLWDPAAWGR